MNEKKLARQRNKEQKMTALINLTKQEDQESQNSPRQDADSSVTNHQKMIQALEDQMNGNKSASSSSRINKRRANTDFHGNEDESECSQDVEKAYRDFMNKRRKLNQASRLVQIYVDQYFLTNRRQKHLLYTENADKLTSPIVLHPCQIQQFIMFNLFGRQSMYRPKWCTVNNVTSVKQMLVLVLEGVSWIDVILSQPALWAHTNHLLSDNTLRMVSPSLYKSDIEEELFLVPLPTAEIANNHRRNPTHNKNDESTVQSLDEELTLDLDKLLGADEVFPRTMIVLSFSDLISEGFPVPLHGYSHNQGPGLEGFRFSKKAYSKVKSHSPMFALDCEMVTTSDQRASLASVCVVDENLQTVYKSLVKPDKPITDYITKYSGMTKEILKDVTTTLCDVQNDLEKLLPSDAILCGQSLNNDLVALRLYHPYVIDTSECYNLKGMPHSKTALRKLAAQFLQKEIQTGSSGHCPEEDAKTTMELVLLKLKTGYSFGNVLADGATSPPRRFFKSAARKDNSKLDENAENAIETKEKKEFADSKPKQTTLNESSTSSPSESRDCIHKVDNQNAMNGKCSSSSLSCEKSESDSSDIPSASSDSISDKTMRQSCIGIGAAITPPSAFSRRNIPQTEVNMFDLVGHQDDNHALICTKCLSMRRPQNKSHVDIYELDKTKHIIKKTQKALKTGAKLVYSKVVAEKSSGKTSSQSKKIEKLDEAISNLWDDLAVGGLFCLVLSGTEHQEGAFMFNAKRPPPVSASQTQQPQESDDDDGNSSYYGV